MRRGDISKLRKAQEKQNSMLYTASSQIIVLRPCCGQSSGLHAHAQRELATRSGRCQDELTGPGVWICSKMSITAATVPS